MTVAFGALTALDAVDLEVRPGEIVGVIGPNGAGKTTLLDVVAGVTRPVAGTLQLDGTPLDPAPHKLSRLGIARTVQGLGLDETEPVAELVLDGAESAPRTGFGAALRALPRRDRGNRDAREHALLLLRELGLTSVTAEAFSAVPYGLKVRVALARALMSSPRLLLLDELAAGLGADEMRALGDVLRAVVDRPGRDCAILLVDHQIPLIAQACDTVLVLDEGRIVARGTPDDLAADPAVASAYLGAG